MTTAHEGDGARAEGPDTSTGISAVTGFLLRKAQEEALLIGAKAAADADTALARARTEAEAVLADARAAGAREGAALATADVALARRRARTIVLGAQREVYEELRRDARTAATALRGDRALMDDLRRLALDRAGPGARVTDHADGGFVAVGPGTRVECSLPALADRAVDALGAEVERLWAS